MKLKKNKKEYVVMAFICIDKNKKDFRLFDIRNLEGFILTDDKD